MGTPVSVHVWMVRCGWGPCGAWVGEENGDGDWDLGLRWISRIEIPSGEYGFGKWIGELKMWVRCGRID